jgi:mRNA interferase MazF
MPSYLKSDVILVRYPFSDLSSSKVRPAVVVSAPHRSQDLFIVPLTSKVMALRDGEFVLMNWSGAGLNVVTAVKRGIYTVSPTLVLKQIGNLVVEDADRLDQSLIDWLGTR